MTTQEGQAPDNAVTITPTDLLGTSEVTERLSISKSTLRRLNDLGQLRPFRIMAGPTGAWLYLRRDVDAYAEDYSTRLDVDAYAKALTEPNELDDNEE